MPITVDAKEFRQRMQRVESLLHQVESFSDPAVRACMREIVQTLMEFHGAGLERITERLVENGPVGVALLDKLARDEVVSHLLLLYGLHPLGLEERVSQALERVRPLLATHGGDVELIAATADGLVQLRMQGSCHNCPSSAATLKSTIEQAVLDAVPELTELRVEEDEPIPLPGSNGKKRMELPLLVH